MTLKLNFSLTLPIKVKQRALDWSQEIARNHETFFVLTFEVNHPHITVYAAEFLEETLPLVLEAAGRAVAACQPLVCEVQQVETHAGYIGVELVRSAPIERFHRAIVEALSPLRIPQSYTAGQEYYGMPFTPLQIDYLNRYGYADSLELYEPHFTLTRLIKKEDAEKVVRAIDWDIKSFTVYSCGLYLMGESHGTCQKLLQEYSFKHK